MRIVRLSINRWRNLRDVDLEVQDQPTLVCLIGHLREIVLGYFDTVIAPQVKPVNAPSTGEGTADD